MELETINKLTMTSREIAELTNKEHKNVLRDILALKLTYKTMKEGMPKIEQTPYVHPQNSQTYYEYNLSRMQCLDLLTGYNAELRIKVNRRWEELEKRNLPQLPQSFADALLLAGKLEKEKEQALLLIEEQKPLVNLAKSIEATEGCISFKKMADIHFNFGRNTLMKKMRDASVLTSNNNPYRRYIDQGLFEVDEKNINGLLISTTFITPKGQIWIMDNLRRLNI